jgi:hypothetical protein
MEDPLIANKELFYWNMKFWLPPCPHLPGKGYEWQRDDSPSVGQ